MDVYKCRPYYVLNIVFAFPLPLGHKTYLAVHTLSPLFLSLLWFLSQTLCDILVINNIYCIFSFTLFIIIIIIVDVFC